jgi:chemotaxis protein methyltransferase WspC
VVITETWFFRDREPFNALVRLVLNERAPTNGTHPLRLLSIPCSSGEEPYSMAMALLDARVPRDYFQVDGVDISARALLRAKRAIYGKNSFRGKDLGFRDRHFRAGKEGFTLNAAVRHSVRFFQDNLLSDSFLAGKGPYDFIFCRNLLIYFDQPTQRIALEKICRLLKPNGMLFVGAAELPLVMENGFVSANIPMAFVCKKAGENHVRPVNSVGRPKILPFPVAAAPVATLHDERPKAADAARPMPPRSTSSKPQSADSTDLETAQSLADAGKREEALALCQKHLRENGASAQAHYLMGLLLDSAGDSTAIEYYRKALYLEPNHYETLLQMALLAQKEGNTALARTFKNRAERLKLKTG